VGHGPPGQLSRTFTHHPKTEKKTEKMQMFRRTRDGGVSVWLPPGEATLLRTLVVPVLDLLGESGRPGETGYPQTQGGTADDLDRLLAEAVEAAEAAEAPSIPDDPVLARLLPDAYADDPAAAGEFRRYTESGLRSAKVAAARTVLGTLPEDGGKVRLSADEAQAWLRAINDIRLALGVRLDITEDRDAMLEQASQGSPQAAGLWIYDWLTLIQETLVEALW
jgi:hypothetical protein